MTTMLTNGFIITVVPLLSALIGIGFFIMRIRGGFTSGPMRVFYVLTGGVSGGGCGLVMYITELGENDTTFYISAALVLFYVFIYNAPLRSN